jgi:hypothetical protein
MKNLVLAGLTLFSVSAFSQSYLVLSNGVTLTTDKAGFVYDFNHFNLPYKIQVNGGQFFVVEERLVTVDASGYLYKKDMSLDEVKGKGSNYFINDDNHLVTIDESGFYYKFDKDKNVFKKAKNFGGNFFTVKMDDRNPAVDLYTINSKGNYFKMSVQGLNPAEITVFGGNYFATSRGVVYTVNQDGNVFSKAEVTFGRITRRGGKFMIDAQDKIYTVSQEGFLMLPTLPSTFKIANMVKLGTNYMIDSDGKIFTVDSMGNINERTVADHDVRSARILAF